MSRDVSAQFNKFAGKEVAVTEVPWEREFRGEKYSGVSVRINENDDTYKSLVAEVNKSGLRLRLWVPGTAGTMDVQMNRLNVYVEKEADGKYRIQPNIRLG
jgi:hypothetical protein